VPDRPGFIAGGDFFNESPGADKLQRLEQITLAIAHVAAQG